MLKPGSNKLKESEAEIIKELHMFEEQEDKTLKNFEMETKKQEEENSENSQQQQQKIEEVEGGGTSMRSSIIDENRGDLNDDSPKMTPDAGPKLTSSTPPIGMKSLNFYINF